MTRPFNFSAGPAALPESVLRQAADEMLDWHGTRHVGDGDEPPRQGVHRRSMPRPRPLLRELLAVPGELQGALPAGRRDRRERDRADEHAARPRRSADYVNTGEWSKRSIEEAGAVRAGQRRRQRRGDGSRRSRRRPSGSSTRTRPTCTSAPTRPSAASNTTGRPTPARCRWSPTCRRTSCRARSTSSRYGLIYGGAQKNIGPAGLTIVIVRDDLLGGALPITPSAFDYTEQAANDSMLNTPPTYAIYIAGLVFHWIKAQGGLAAMEARNRAKAALLYDSLDASAFYRSPVARADRSLHERALQAARRGARRARSSRARRPRHGAVSRATASSAACAPRSTTRCRSRACSALVSYMREFETKNG